MLPDPGYAYNTNLMFEGSDPDIYVPHENYGQYLFKFSLYSPGLSYNFRIFDSAFAYSPLGDGNYAITGFAPGNSLTGDIALPYWNAVPVTQIADNAFSGHSGITGVTVPNHITSIASNAFYGCGSLTGTTIPS
jgi:hypothetical protein